MLSRIQRSIYASLLALVGLASAGGCSQDNPNAPNIDAPIVTDDAPQSSEEAAAQSEPPPIEYKGRRSR